MPFPFESQNENETATAARLGSHLGAPVFPAQVNPQGKHLAPYALIPAGADLVALPAAESSPARHSGAATLDDLGSFCRYIEHVAECLHTPIIYASEGNYPTSLARFVAVMDDHTRTGIPGYREFRAIYAPQISPELETWIGRNNHKFSQIEFAEFIERNLGAIREPASADLLEMILNFEATRTAEFRSAARLDTGAVNLAWVDSTSGRSGGEVKLPAGLELEAPIFANGAPEMIRARLRFRVQDAALAIWYELPPVLRLYRAGFDALLEELQDAAPAGAVIVRGRPE